MHGAKPRNAQRRSNRDSSAAAELSQNSMAAIARVVSGALAVFAGLAFAGPAASAVATPTPISPAPNAAVQALPSFAWNPVAGADRYEFAIAADAGFNSPSLGRGEGQFFTKNTRATVKKTLPNGTYWWRVRAVAANGDVSAWAEPRPLRKQWTLAPRLLSPTDGAITSHPATPLVLKWSAVPYAAKYLVTIASDPALGSAVLAQSNVETHGTSYAPRALLLPPGTYYWGVVPLDAQGHRGAASAVASFTWMWPTTTATTIGDLRVDSEVYDPFFTWDPVPGAARYELEINPSQDFAPGSKVCCTGPIISPSHSPTSLLRDNTYYWRVRSLDAFGNAGVWNSGPPFTKTFDKVPPVTAPSVKNARMRDHLSDPGSDLNPGAAGYQTSVPIITWDPVPGASSYEVDVFPFEDGMCNWSSSAVDHWHSTTATNAWTPLGSQWNNVKPYADDRPVANELRRPIAGHEYCARIRARSDRDSANEEVYGEYTYLGGGTSPAFQWVGPPAGGSCSPSCSTGYLGSGDYLIPATGTTATRMPLFTWKPLAGKQSYFVLVAKDPSFSNIVDYAFTQVPAYAPRGSSWIMSYPDETTLYYWAVLPATDLNGNGAVGNPLAAAPQSFRKESNPPTLTSPTAGELVTGQPTFRWSPAEGARRYRLQVSQDPAFGTLLDDVTTASTAYTSNTSYPADTLLYWRVRADDENLIGLRWSPVGSFQRRLPAPAPHFDAVGTDMYPVITWDPVPGAVSYRIAVDEPDGDHAEYDDFRSAAAAFVKITGTGITGVRVRANFATKSTTTTPGPWSPTIHHTRTVGEPTGAATSAGPSFVLFSWDAKPGAKQYRVVVSTREDFSVTVEDIRTDSTSYAPLLNHTYYLRGGKFWWRVAAIDDDLNVGDFTRPHTFALTANGTVRTSQRLRLTLRGNLRAKRTRPLVVRVTSGGRPVPGARVRAFGSGLRMKWRRTNRAGRVVFRLRPTRRGILYVQATKAGYLVASARARVR
jgi:hypothetical protein